jgi:hypothetical protein
VVFDDGHYLFARKVVLALGNFPAGHPKLADRRFTRARVIFATPGRRRPWTASPRRAIS